MPVKKKSCLLNLAYQLRVILFKLKPNNMKLTKATFAIAFAIAVAFTSCKAKDSDIQTSVQSKETTSVSVTVNGGVATLKGEVADEAAKMKAEEIAKGEKGVKSVVNNLTVTAPVVFVPPVIVADNPLTASVVDAVKDHPTVTAAVANGVITLTGTIKKADLPKLMMKLSSLHPKNIENKLTVN